MLLLFINIYNAMLTGVWQPYTTLQSAFQVDSMKNELNALGTFLTSIFGDGQMVDLGSQMQMANPNGLVNLVAIILALITSIGIVVVAVKGVKKAFGVFFMLYR